MNYEVTGPLFGQLQGNRNCGILASTIEGSGDRERKWEGKFHPQGLKLVFLHKMIYKGYQRRPNVNQKDYVVYLYKKYLFMRKFLLLNIRFRRKEF